MKNDYLTVEDYKRYISLFKLSEEDSKEINSIINNVIMILILRGETVQNSPTEYLKPIMTSKDYAKINKVLNIQLNFKVERETKKHMQQLINENKYTQEEIQKKVEDFEEKLRKDYGMRKNSKSFKNTII